MKLPPPDWPAIFAAVRRMIRPFPLPYVTQLALGFARDPVKLPFAVLASTVVSLRTQDKVTASASARLLSLADTPDRLATLPEERIASAIYPCGFYRTKAKQLRRIAGILIELYGGRVPRDLEALLKLPGVGRKTANLVLTEGFGDFGVCVDTHVHRISNRLGIVRTKTPEETEMRLRSILPRRYWKKINLWFVMFGQNHCRPVGPKCVTCLLRPFCPFARARKAPPAL